MLGIVSSTDAQLRPIRLFTAPRSGAELISATWITGLPTRGPFVYLLDATVYTWQLENVLYRHRAQVTAWGAVFLTP